MKKIFTFLICTFFAISSFAAINAGRLTITGANKVLSVIIDDRQYENITGAITLDDLSAGYHQVKVYEMKNSRRSARRADRGRLIYSSRLLIKPYYHVNIAVRPSGEISIFEEQLNQRGRDDRNNYPRSDGRWNEGRGNNGRWNEGRGNDGRWNEGHGNDGRPGDGRDYSQPMSDRMLQSAKEAIRRESFDKDKAMLAKQIVSNNTLYVGQVRELMQVFSFDDSKLDFAKFAYARTIDRNNYFTLYELFSFRKNKEDLMNYIQSYRF